jgi:hypothetical protein
MSRWRSVGATNIARESAPLLPLDAPHAIDADRLAKILYLSLPSVRKQQVGMAPQLITDTPADIDLPWLRQAFQPSSNIDAVAVDIAIVGNHIAGIYANAKPQAAIGCGPGTVLGQFMLDLKAQYTAPTALATSTSSPSPALRIRRPPCSAILGSIESLM